MKQLTTKNIESDAGTGPGWYILYRMENGLIKRKYVGRSDTNLQARLKTWVGIPYTHFDCRGNASASAAYRAECEYYHYNKNSLDNAEYPNKPAGLTGIGCPACNR